MWIAKYKLVIMVQHLFWRTHSINLPDNNTFNDCYDKLLESGGAQRRKKNLEIVVRQKKLDEEQKFA